MLMGQHEVLILARRTRGTLDGFVAFVVKIKFDAFEMERRLGKRKGIRVGRIVNEDVLTAY